MLTVEVIHCIHPALAAFVEGLCGPKVAAVHAFLHTVGQARVAIVRPRTWPTIVGATGARLATVALAIPIVTTVVVLLGTLISAVSR